MALPNVDEQCNLPRLRRNANSELHQEIKTRLGGDWSAQAKIKTFPNRPNSSNILPEPPQPLNKLKNLGKTVKIIEKCKKNYKNIRKS